MWFGCEVFFFGHHAWGTRIGSVTAMTFRTDCFPFLKMLSLKGINEKCFVLKAMANFVKLNSNLSPGLGGTQHKKQHRG